MKTVAHVLLFVLAVAVFYFGVGVGLIVNPDLGSVFWLAAAGIAGGNIFWIVRSKK